MRRNRGAIRFKQPRGYDAKSEGRNPKAEGNSNVQKPKTALATALKDFRLRGFGPKIALNILSGISVTTFRGAVANGDVKALSQISGVGKKTAERIVVELKDKIGAAGAWEALSAQRALSPEDQKLNDAVLALLALGFKQLEAHDAVRKAQGALGPQTTVEALVRACLRKGA